MVGEGGGEAQVEARFAKGEVNALVCVMWQEGSTNGRSRAREGVREVGPAVEQEQGLAMGASSGVPAGERERGTGGREVEDWRMFFSSCLVHLLSSRVAWLHGCTERAARCAQPGKAEEIFFGARWWPAQGVVVASCRTKAGAGLALAHGRCGSPRTAGWRTRVCAGREARSRESEKKKLDAGP